MYVWHKNVRSRLTKQAEPRRIRDVDRVSGTAMANRRWLRRLVRLQNRHNSNQRGAVEAPLRRNASTTPTTNKTNPTPATNSAV